MARKIFNNILNAVIIILVCLLLISFCHIKPANAEPYAEAGMMYNFDAFGITSNLVAHIEGGYTFSGIDKIDVDIFARHESDPENSGSNDLIANESVGVNVRYNFK